MRIAPGYVPPLYTPRDAGGHRPSPRREISCDFPTEAQPGELATLMRLLNGSEPSCHTVSADEREFLEMRRRECGG